MRDPWKISTLVLAVALVLVVGRAAVPIAAADKAEKQPHMKAALVSLKQAKNQLEKASSDKGGHRIKAIELTTAAMAEVEKGIAFDDAR